MQRAVAVRCVHCLAQVEVELRPGLIPTCTACRKPLEIDPDVLGEASSHGRVFPDEASVPAVWAVGDVILERYEVAAALGEGSLGPLHRVLHHTWGIPLAVRSLRSADELPGGLEALIREGQAWVRLGFHDHLAGCYYVRTLGGLPRLFIEHVEGTSLAEAIRDRRLYRGGRARTLERLFDIAIQSARGLHYLHEQGALHQDVKPSNLLLTPDGTVKVTDPGLSRARLTPPGVRRPPGLPVFLPSPYASPEQLESLKQDLDARPLERLIRLTRHSDIWSWGMCVLELFCGQLPEDIRSGARPIERWLPKGGAADGPPVLPGGLIALLERCLAFNPEHRPRDLNEAGEALQRIYQLELGTAYPRESRASGPMLADGLNNQAVALLDLDQGGPAMVLLERALAADERHIYASYNRGLLAWRAGRMNDDALVRTLREVQAANPHTWEDDHLLAWVHVERGDTEAARAVLDGAREQLEASPLGAEQAMAARAALRSGCHPQQKLMGHTGDVLGVDLTADGATACSTGADNSLRVWDVVGGQVRQILWDDARVAGVAVFSDGRMAVSFPAEGWSPQVWDLRTGQRMQLLRGHTDVVRSVSLSTDGELAVTASRDRTVRVWSLSTGECLRVLEGHGDEVLAVALAADPRRAISGGRDRAVRVWDVISGECLATLEGHTDQVLTVAVSDGARLAISGSADKTVRVWEPSSGRCLATLKGHTAAVKSVALTADGCWAVSVSRDDTLRAWDLSAGRCVRTAASFGATSVAMTPDGRTGITSHFGELRTWQVVAELPVSPVFMVPPRRDVQTLARQRELAAMLERTKTAVVRRDWRGAILELEAARAMPGYERSPEALTLWGEVGGEVARGPLRDVWVSRLFKGHGREVTRIALAPDGTRALSMDSSGILQAWEVGSGRVLWMRDSQVDSVGLALTPDGKQQISAGRDDAIRIREVESGRTVQVLRDLKEGLSGVAFNAFSDLLAYVGGGAPAQVVRVIRVGQSRFMHLLYGHDDLVTGLLMTPDGRTLVSSSRDGTLRVWDLSSGRCLGVLGGEGGAISSLAITPDGARAITGGMDGSVRVWDLASLKAVCALATSGGPVHGVAITPDGRLAVSAGHSGLVRLWEVDTGTCLRELAGHEGPVLDVAVAWNGSVVLSAGADRSVRAWHLDWGLEPREAADWDEGARPWIGIFLACRSPLGEDGRAVSPTVTGDDLPEQLRLLRWGGYGWLRSEGVFRELTRVGDLATARHRAATNRIGLANRLLSKARTALEQDDWRTAAADLATVKSMPELERSLELLALWADVSRKTSRGGLQQVWEHRRVAAPDLYRAAMTPDGRLALVGGFDGMVALCDLSLGRIVRWLQGEPGASGPKEEHLVALYLTPDGKHAASIGERGGLRVWEAASGRCLQALGTGSIRLTDACFLAGGRAVAIGGEDGSLNLLESSTGRRIRSLQGHTGAVVALSTGANGRRIVSVGADRSFRVWDTNAGALISSWTAPDLVTRVMLSDDAGFILSAGASGALHLWDTRNGDLLRTLEGHSDVVRDVAISADNRVAVSAGSDWTIRVWDLQTGRCLKVLEGAGAHRNRVRALTMTPDGRWMASLSRDGTLRLWYLDWETGG